MKIRGKRRKLRPAGELGLGVTIIILAFFLVTGYVSYHGNLAKNRELRAIENELKHEIDVLRAKVLDLLNQEGELGK